MIIIRLFLLFIGIPGPPKEFLDCLKSLGVQHRVKDGPDLEEDGLEIIE